MFDAVIIGGGASGLCAAVRLKEKYPQINTAVLETLDRVGKKLITTGNGRCNITNSNADATRYHGADTDFINNVLKRYGVKNTVEFFGNCGVDIVFEDDGRAYPASYQAGSVVDALRFSAQEKGVTIINNVHVDDIKFGKTFKLVYDGGIYEAKSVIIAAGLLSGGGKLGCDGSVLNILKKHGVSTVGLSPAIVQLKTENNITKQLKGIKVTANVSIRRNNKTLRSEYGEVLFTDYGLSGPPVLQVSRFAGVGGSAAEVCIDFKPEYNYGELAQHLKKRREKLADRSAAEFLTGFINKRIGQVLLKICGVDMQSAVSAINDKNLTDITALLKCLKFKVTGSTGFVNSQVTAGGINASELDGSLQFRRIKGMFACGEIIDVDGDCGGYNLQWAFSSAFCAVDGVADYLGENK